MWQGKKLFEGLEGARQTNRKDSGRKPDPVSNYDPAGPAECSNSEHKSIMESTYYHFK